jgi:hypothetical protein
MEDTAEVIKNGVKIVGETFLPGASLLLDGNLPNGALHAAVGIGARMILGPIGLILVAADSYSKSVSQKYIWEHATGALGMAREKVKPTATAEQSTAT